MHGDLYLCFVAYEDNEQLEAGDTLIHTFVKPNWQYCTTRYFYFWGTINSVTARSTTGLFTKHKTEYPWQQIINEPWRAFVKEPTWQKIIDEPWTS